MALVLAAAALTACSESVGPPLGTSAEALTQTLTIRRGTFGTVADATISASAQNKNFGNQKQLQVSAKNEALLRFDLASIPANAVIESANLTLAFNGGEDEDDDDCDDGDHEGHRIAPINLKRVTAAWAEATVTYRSFNQQFAPAVAGTIVLPNRTSAKTVDVRALVQGWVAGTYPNLGLILVTAGKQHALIVSSEHTTVARRPVLVIRYAVPEDHCAADPCAHGTCTNTLDGFTCACSPGFDGATCAHDIDDCAPNPCQNGGACTDDVNGFACTCAAGFTGLTCATNVDDCAANPCQHGGTCTDGVGGHVCACAPGFSGVDCETVDVCSATSNPCQHGGACTLLLGNTYTCACAPDFTGSNCESPVNDCPVNACSGHGTCADGAGTYTCTCDPGYTGGDCETAIDHCVVGACANGGLCTNTVDGFTCACPAGYDGPTCANDINECAGSPCLNGGQCIDGVGTFTCRCAGYYTGTSCEIPPAVCDPGRQLTVFGCLPCAAGTYSADGAACLACPDGTISNNMGSTSCVACPAGTGADPTHTTCSACPPGTASSGDGVCVVCPNDTNPEQTACVQRTGINVVAPRGTAGSNLVVGGFLATVTAPVAGETIDFVVQGAGVLVHQSALTDASGAAAIQVNLPAGTYDITATFYGSQTYGHSIGQGTLVVDRAVSGFNSILIDGLPFVGNSLVFVTNLTRLSPPVALVSGAAVTYTSTAPGGAVTSLGTITDPFGEANVTFSPATRGVYEVTAQFGGNASLLPATSATAQYAVYQKTQLVVSADQGQAGQQVHVAAHLVTPPSFAPLAGQLVTFDFGGVVPSTSAVTNGAGVAQVTVTVPTAGTYPFIASFANLADYFVDQNGNQIATTADGTLNIAAPPSCAAGTGLDANSGTCVACAPGTASSGDGVCVACPDGPNADQTACLEATRLVVAPANGFAGADIQLHATLTTGAGVPVSGVLVDFLVTAGVPVASGAAFTDANGVAVITVNIPVVGSGYTTSASFAGSLQLKASSGGSTLDLMKALTNLDAITIQGAFGGSGGFVGEGLTLTTTLTRVVAPTGLVAGRQVTFTVTAPDGSATTVTTSTNPVGQAAATVLQTRRGVYTVSARFTGDNGLSGTDSPTVTHVVYEKTQLSVPAAAGQGGLPTVVTANLVTLPSFGPLGGQTVTFTFDGGIPPVSAVTDAAGTARATVTFPAGTYAVNAAFANLASYFVDANGDPVATTAAATIVISP